MWCCCMQAGETPLHGAAYKGHVEVVGKLLAAGAAANASRNVPTPSISHQ
jgi:ankyrin repeat protein